MTQQVFKDFDHIVSHLSEYCARRQPGLLVIDGFRGSGKTTLAGSLAGPLGAVHFEIDKFWNREEGYVAHIRYADLRQSLCATMNEPQWVILEGICVQGVPKRNGLIESASVYVKRLVANFWADGRILDEAGSTEEAITLEEEGTQTFSKFIRRDSVTDSAHLKLQLTAEVLTYHFEFRPNKRSTFVYTWDDRD